MTPTAATDSRFRYFKLKSALKGIGGAGSVTAWQSPRVVMSFTWLWMLSEFSPFLVTLFYGGSVSLVSHVWRNSLIAFLCLEIKWHYQLDVCGAMLAGEIVCLRRTKSLTGTQTVQALVKPSIFRIVRFR